MRNLHIRDYQKSDWSQVLEMVKETMIYHMEIQKPVRFTRISKKLLPNYLLSLILKHQNKTSKLIVASVNKKLVGFIYGHKDKQDKELKKSAVKSGTIEELYISKEFRGKGIAKKLMLAMEKYLREEKCQLIRLKDVHATNKQAQDFYQNLNYQPRVIEYAKRVG